MRSSKDTDLRDKVRKKYREAIVENIEVIPAISEVDFYADESDKRVAIYARVSTDDADQISSFELQQAHYEHLISQHPGWNLVKIYADEYASYPEQNQAFALSPKGSNRAVLSYVTIQISYRSLMDLVF